MSDNYVKVYSDIFIKYLFGKEGNEDILMDFINDVLNFRFLKNNDDLHNMSYLALKSRPNIALTDLLFIHFIELPKLFNTNKSIEEMTDLEKWVYFFINEGKEVSNMEVLIKSDDTLNKAHQEYTRFTADDELREIYEMRLEGQRIKETQIYAAREEGIKKGIIETAKNLKKIGIDTTKISKATGLSIEEINKL